MNKIIKFSKIVSGLGSVILLVVIIGLLIDKGIPYRGDETAIVIITVLTSLCTLFNLSKSTSQSKSQRDDGIFSLWLKRKTLEEKKRIAELEK